MRLSGILYSPQNYHPQGPWILHCISTLIHELRTRPPAAWWSSPNSWASPPGDPTLWRSDDHLRWSGKLTSFDQEITGLDLEILIQDVYIYIYILFHIIIYLLYLDGIFGSFWIQIHCFVARRPRPLGLPLPIWWWICQTGPVYWITTPSGKISGRAISTFFSIYHINWQTSRGDRKPSGNHFSETASLHHRFRHVATCLDPSRNTATQNAGDDVPTTEDFHGVTRTRLCYSLAMYIYHAWICWRTPTELYTANGKLPLSSVDLGKIGYSRNGPMHDWPKLKSLLFTGWRYLNWCHQSNM